MKAMQEVAEQVRPLTHAMQYADETDVVQSTNRTFDVLDRLRRYQQILGHIEDFVHQKSEQLDAWSTNSGPSNLDFSEIGKEINWDAAPDRLRLGDTSGLKTVISDMIQKAAAFAEVVTVSRDLGISPVSLVVGLIAHSEAPKNRTAARIAKAILCNPEDEKIKSTSKILRLN